MIELGPFDLIEPVGRGGMGEVWRARHREQGTPAAMKIITGEAALEPETGRRFFNEVRAVARLAHPGIIMVLDHGAIPELTARQSSGRIKAGAPYLAMELASGGSLQRYRDSGLSWWDVKTVLLSLLDALAHAHARGVIHRDLKPGNVLLCTSADVRPGLKLSDFGIATAVDWHVRSGSLNTVVGTLHYIAPEQLLGHWRDYGPWTDLYSLGCMAWRMVSGQLPFAGKRGPKLMRAQLFESPPPLQPRMPIPPGFEEWVDRLMQKGIDRRFQRAADAAWALSNLGDPPVTGPKESVFERGPHDLVDTHDPLVVSEVTTLVLEAGFEPPREEDQAITQLIPLLAHHREPDATERMPLPETWRRPLPPPPPTQLLGAGLGLFGLRDVPLLGREEERDTIWRVLRRVHEHGRGEAIVLRGAAGTGKRRLGQWLTERAHELGAVEVAKVALQPDEPATAGVRRLMERFLTTQKLEPEEVDERVQDWQDANGGADADLTGRIVALLRGGKGLDSAEDRYCTIADLLARAAAKRPVLLVLEDAHNATDALGLASHIMRRQARDPFGVLVLLTVRDDALAARIAAKARVEALLRLPQTHAVRLGPLGPLEHADLVEALLPMERTTSAMLQERTRGNPQFAVELLTNWVQRGALKLERRGFAVDEDVASTLPEELRFPVEQLVESLPAAALPWLERAAVLGTRVTRTEWDAVCGDDPDDVRDALVERLVRRTLVEEREDGFVFTNPMLQESLTHRAREERRLKRHHRACAKMLRSREGVADRLGRHLLEAGELDEALDPLFRGVEDRRHRMGLQPALSLLGTAEAAMARAQLAREDARWGRVWLLRARLLRAQMRYSEADQWCDSALDGSRRYLWEAIHPEALRQKALALIGARKLTEADDTLDELHNWIGKHNSDFFLPRYHEAKGLVAANRREFQHARHHLDRAVIGYVDTDQEVGMAHCWRIMASYVGMYPNHEVESLYRRALAIYERHGRPAYVALCLNGIAEMARMRGDLQAAEEGYQQAVKTFHDAGQHAIIPTLNLGVVRLKRGRFLEARRVGESARRILQPAGRMTLLAAAHATILPCTAAIGDWAGWDHHLHRIRGLLERSNFVDPDLAWSLQLAGRLAAEAGRVDRALQAYGIARRQWVSMGDIDRITEIETVLDAL